MINLLSLRHDELTEAQHDDLGRYRHQVFVEQLGWKLPARPDVPGRERDQFDHLDTRYILALDGRGQVCGCSRLLPTTEPYLLGEVFDFLCDEAPPCSADTWEISRYAAQGLEHGRLPMRVFWYSLHSAWVMGAQSVVAVTTVALERYFHRNGVEQTRLGPAIRRDGDHLVALRFPAWQPNGATTLSGHLTTFRHPAPRPQFAMV